MDDGMSLPNLARNNLAEEAYRVLRDCIFSQQFPCGEQLDLSSIEEQLGISRTPIKAAVDRLAAEGLVEIVPRRGTYVAELSLKTIDNAFRVREVLECYAVANSVEHMADEQLQQLAQIVAEMRRITQSEDPDTMYLHYTAADHDFHTLIIEAANNDVLSDLCDRVVMRVHFARVRYAPSGIDFDQLTKEHQDILAAFQKRDVKTAQARMREHIRGARSAMPGDNGSEMDGE
jgi:DNA-binding GntR family transcriptional regulator